MESTTNQIEEQEAITDIALIEQDKSTVKILQEDDLKNLKDAVEKIKSFKRKYGIKKMLVTDIESKDQKEKLRLAIAEVRTTKTSLEKDKKEKTLPYRNTVTYINNNYDKVIDAAESILTPLKDHKKEVDELIEAEEKKAELELQERVNNRVKRLIDEGATFDGSYYSIGSDQFNVPTISLGIVDIQTTPDGIFENILQQVIEKASIIAVETEKSNAEKKRLEDERIAKELEDKQVFDLQQAQLKKEQDELAAELAEFKKQKEELRLAQEKMNKEKLDEQVRLSNEAATKAKNRINARYEQLFALGMEFNSQYGCYIYEDINVDNATEINLFNEDEWNDLIAKIIPAISERVLMTEKKAAEAKNISDKVIADKAITDKKEKDEMDEKTRIESLNKQGDKAVWNDFISKLKAIAYPEMKSKDFKNKVGSVRDFISDLK